MLKNMVQMGSDEQQMSKMQLLQQNYSMKQTNKKQKGQNFSTIQTAYDTLQNQSLNTGKGKKQQYLGMTTIQQASSNGSNGTRQMGMHNRYATAQFNPNPVFHSLGPNGPIISTDGSGGQIYNNTSIPKYSTHSNFFNIQNGSRLGAQSNLQPKSKRVKNQTVTVSGSLGPGGGIFSPKNAPTNSFGFGFGNTLFQSNITTPQNPRNSNTQQLFTLDSNVPPPSFSNQLMSSLQAGSNPQPSANLTASLTVSGKQNSQPAPKLGQKKRGSSITNSHNLQLQQNNNTISYGTRPQDIQSDNSNKALFKRRRDHSKGKKSAQKYGTIQNEKGMTTVGSQRNHINVTKPPLVDEKRSTQISQKKNRSKNQNLTIQPNEALNIQVTNTGNVSVKNQNLFSPVVGNTQVQRRHQATMDNSLQQIHYQQQQEHLNNLNRIQHQLQLKKQQRANLMAGTLTNLDVTSPTGTFSEFQTQSYLRLQQNSIDLNLSPANKKVTLNSSFLQQNYAPHLLL